MTGRDAAPGVPRPSADPRAGPLAALVAQLGHSEWRSPAEIAAGQRRQLGALAAHCAAQSPQFRARLEAAGLDAVALAQPGGLRRLTPMGRRDVQAWDQLHCREVPARHMPLGEASTSGSTGEPVRVVRTAVNQLDWLAMTMRDHLWHGREFGGRLAAIRANISAPAEQTTWGPPVNLLYESGPSLSLPIALDAADLVRALADFGPTSLIAYPSTLLAIAEQLERQGARLTSLRELRTVGETLPASTREAVRRVVGLPIADTYSSQEVGYIALQCPASGFYHVMAETLIVEVLSPAGAACGEGAVGRVVVTDLRNFATPLIRYDIGDYAEVAGPCPCGRGLPTLRRILGRERNFVRMPDGRRHWPLVGFAGFRAIAPVVQYQLIQVEAEAIEARLVVERPLASAEETALAAHIQAALGHPFEIRFTYFTGRLPTGPSGKFEEFVCRVV
ncbi:MAG TPA: AMP-binding protein [Caulobacteraceae bacterium]|nr:AMP-binding protein [Caulobacteraceae bacterium]